VRAPRIKDATVKNWTLFYREMCREKVPVLLAITGLEAEDYRDEWWSKNENTFCNYGIFPTDVACIVATRGKKKNGRHTYDEEYEESTRQMQTKLTMHYLKKPWSIPRRVWYRSMFRIPFFDRIRWLIGMSSQCSLEQKLKEEYSMKPADAKELATSLFQDR